MAPTSPHVTPPIILEQSNDLANFHVTATLAALHNAPADRLAASDGTPKEAALSRTSTVPDPFEAASGLCGRAGS